MFTRLDRHPRSHPAESKKLPVIVGSDDMYDELDLSAVLACGDLEGAPQKGPATTVPGEKARPPSPGLEVIVRLPREYSFSTVTCLMPL